MTDLHTNDPQTDAAHRADENKRRADEQRQIEDQRREDAEKRADEARNANYERDKKRIEEEHKTNEDRIAAARKAAEARRAEDARRAALSPADRATEDDKRAAMTPEERAKDDESKGIIGGPEQFDQINLLAGQSQFVILNEPHHTAEFILTEANGQRSRENAYLADPVTVTVGMPLKKTAAATGTQFATYVPAAAGADCDALAMYAGGSLPGQGLRISVIARDAEVNGNLITWGAITAPEQLLGIAQLATHGIIVRL